MSDSQQTGGKIACTQYLSRSNRVLGVVVDVVIHHQIDKTGWSTYICNQINIPVLLFSQHQCVIILQSGYISSIYVK